MSNRMFLTPDELGIDAQQRQALIHTLSDLQTGKLNEETLNMSNWCNCLCGYANTAHGAGFRITSIMNRDEGTGLRRLFCENLKNDPAFQAKRLERFLLTGNPDQ